MTKEKKKSSVTIRSEFCKGCGLCVEFCGRGVLVTSKNLNKMGYYYAEPGDMSRCTGCMVCVSVCPDMAVEVYDE